jgi:hypothetical protein
VNPCGRRWRRPRSPTATETQHFRGGAPDLKE